MSETSEPAPGAPPPGAPALSATERFFARMAAAQTVTPVVAVQEAYTPVQTCPDYGAEQFRNQPDATDGRSPGPPPHTPDASTES